MRLDRLKRVCRRQLEVHVSDSASVLREVIEQGFGAGDLSVADRAAGPTIIEHEYLAPVGATGAETLRAMISEARTEMPGMTITVENTVVDGDKVCGRGRWREPFTRPRMTR